MTLDKILILDDKPGNEDHSSFQAIAQLNERQKKLVDYYEVSDELWKLIENGDDVKLLKDFSPYKFVFIHHSFNDPIIGESIMANLIDMLSTTSAVCLFSGNRIESEVPVIRKWSDVFSESSHFEVRRSQYHNNLKNFIDSHLLSGKYHIKYLYNPYLNPLKDKAYSLLDMIKTDLEQSIEFAVESNYFKELLFLYGYGNIYDISNRCLEMTDDEFIETLEDFIETN